MAFVANFYTFSKKRNSTKIPSSGAVPAQIDLKEETSVIRPVIYVSGISGPYVLNYCYIAEFSRYYFIENWTWENGRWAAELDIDVLASYKAAIGASSQYVVRASAAYNGRITDTVYPALANYSYDGVVLGRNQRQSVIGGYFILGVVSSSGGVLGSATYYVFDWHTMAYFRGVLLSNVNWTNVTEITDELLQTLFNPFQYILSCKWTPYLPPTVQLQSVTSIPFGYWTFDISGLSGAVAYLYVTNNIPVSTGKRYDVPDANIPKHPQSSRGMYLCGEAYSDYWLMMTGYGRIKIPNYAIVTGYGISIYETLDFVSGDSILNVFVGSGANETTTPAVTAHSHFMIDLPFAQVDQDILSAAVDATSAITGAGKSLLSLDVGGAIQNAVTGIANTVRDIAPSVQKGGSPGSWAATGEYGGADMIECVFTNIADEDNADLGRPLCSVRTLSAIPGYIMCANAHLATTGTETEQRTIEEFLNGGFFYE